jgi:exosortase
MEQAKIIADPSTRRRMLVVLPLLAAGLLWASWPTLFKMAKVWSEDARYSHGFLVPAFAVFLLWHRRGLLVDRALRPSWWGLPMIAAGAALKMAGVRYNIDWFDAVSLLPSLAGLGLLVGGWAVLRWSAPAIAFLIFMIPLPFRVEVAMGAPLQRLATVSSNYALQTMGLPAVAEGNVILMGDARIGVVEACNGMGMLFMFAAFAVAVVLLIQREPLEKFLILLSAAPIAFLVNVARITLTGLLHETAGHVVADTVYHDLAGWLMMPMALAALWLELLILSYLFLEVEGEAENPTPLAFAMPGGRGSAPPRRGDDRSR